MTSGILWHDLKEPTAEELVRAWGPSLDAGDIKRMTAREVIDGTTRPRFQSRGTYFFGTFVLPVALPEEDRIVYQEVDLVVDSRALITVRKTTENGFGSSPTDPSLGLAEFGLDEADLTTTPGMVVWRLVDRVSDGYLALVTALNDEILEAEDALDQDRVDRRRLEDVRRRLASLRRDLLQIRRTLVPTAEAVRRIKEDRLDAQGGALFPTHVEARFCEVHDKLLRALEGLDIAREQLAGVRDYHHAKVETDQNEVMKRLTVIASILLLPMLIVGVYGQNFDGMPELHWGYGYTFSWGLIAVTTLVQLAYFKRKGWL